MAGGVSERVLVGRACGARPQPAVNKQARNKQHAMEGGSCTETIGSILSVKKTLQNR